MDKYFGFDGDFRRVPKTNFFCSICQRDIKPNAYVEYVYLGDPADHVVDPSKLDGNEIKAPVGSECVNKIPRGYRVK